MPVEDWQEEGQVQNCEGKYLQPRTGTYANSGAFGAASGTLNRSAHARTFAYRTSGPK
jgi:hypothetical protein